MRKNWVEDFFKKGVLLFFIFIFREKLRFKNTFQHLHFKRSVFDDSKKSLFREHDVIIFQNLCLASQRRLWTWGIHSKYLLSVALHFQLFPLSHVCFSFLHGSHISICGVITSDNYFIRRDVISIIHAYTTNYNCKIVIISPGSQGTFVSTPLFCRSLNKIWYLSLTNKRY